MIGSRKYRLSRDAETDLVNIYSFIAETNPIAARRLVKDIEEKIRTIAETGFSGVPRDEMRPCLRALPYRDRCIYFRVTDSHMTVLRILHGRQDISTGDFPESET